MSKHESKDLRTLPRGLSGPHPGARTGFACPVGSSPAGGSLWSTEMWAGWQTEALAVKSPADVTGQADRCQPPESSNQSEKDKM